MKQSFIFLLSGLVLLFSACDKEKEVTLRHPLEAEVEQGSETQSCKVLCLDLVGSSLSGTALQDLIVSAGADLLIAQTGTAVVEGSDAASWLSDHAAQWNHNTVSKASGAVITASLAPVSGNVVTLSASEAATAGYSGLNCASAVIAGTDDSEALLDHVQSGGRWLLCLHGSALDKAFADATFTDCYEGLLGYGESLSPAWLLAGPGVWNLMSGVRITAAEGLSSPSVSFTLNLSQR